MFNVTELENKHKQYQSKILVHKLKIIIPIGLLSLFLIYFLTSDATPNSKKDITLKKSEPLKKQTVMKEQETIITENISKEVVSPDINKTIITENISKEVVSPDINKTIITENTSQEVVSPDINKTIITKSTSPKMILKPSLSFLENMHIDETQKVPLKKEPKKIKQTLNKPQTNLIIKKYNTINIKNLLKAFKKNKNNPALSLFIAKKYYNSANYKKAYEYALITNDIDNDINDAWIVLAKSLVKLNKKSSAMYLLITYIKKSYSSQAKVLLEDIKSGRFHE